MEKFLDILYDVQIPRRFTYLSTSTISTDNGIDKHFNLCSFTSMPDFLSYLRASSVQTDIDWLTNILLYTRILNVPFNSVHLVCKYIGIDKYFTFVSDTSMSHCPHYNQDVNT